MRDRILPKFRSSAFSLNGAERIIGTIDPDVPKIERPKGSLLTNFSRYTGGGGRRTGWPT
jgi:hypothetical protein